MKKGVLLINLGSPDSPSVRDVRKYLRQFLSDKHVIDINPVARFFLVNGIIVPFRAPKSAKLYEHIWTKEGSPLIIHSEQQKELLQKSLGNNFVVELGMRYQNPSIESALKKLAELKTESIIVVPLYPQYAASTTRSSIEEAKRIMKKGIFPAIKFIEKFYEDPRYIEAMAGVAEKYNLQQFDHFIFSYHGLPERQITKESSYCKVNNDCCSSINNNNKLCYRAGCFATSRLLVERLKIPQEKYTIAFQSRLDDKWLKPYSDRVVEQLAKEGKKKILVFSPAFVADCLETIHEIGVEYDHIFKQNGGEKLQLVESLNEHPAWIDALKNIILAS